MMDKQLKPTVLQSRHSPEFEKIEAHRALDEWRYYTGWIKTHG